MLTTESINILRQMRTICQNFADNVIDVSQYKARLFLLAEQFDAPGISQVEKTTVSIIDSTRQYAEHQPDVDKVRQNAEATARIVSAHIPEV